MTPEPKAPRYLPVNPSQASANVAQIRAIKNADDLDAALVKRMRARLGKTKGDGLSAADSKYIANALRRAPVIGPKTIQLLLHLAELAHTDKPERWQAVFDVLKKKCDLDAHLPDEKITTAIHRIADSLSRYKELDDDGVMTLIGLGTVRGIPSIPVRRALEQVRRLHPMTASAAKLFATELRAIPLAPPKPWTIFIYMSSENNLEPYAVDDINDMERTFGKIASVANVVVLCDGGVVSSKDEDLGPAPERNWSGRSRLLLISEDEDGTDGAIVSRAVPIPDDTALGELLKEGKGELNLGKGETLKAATEFVQNGLPSDNLFLSVWSHGLAWKGIAEDEEGGSQSYMIGPAELSKALSDLERPVDVMGFDACLMANSGVSLLLSELGVQYLIGSEELLDAEGWGYDKVFSGFADIVRRKGELTPERLAHSLVDHAAGTTLSAVRLSDAKDLWARLDDLGEAMLAEGGRKNEKIQALIEGLPRYGSYGVDASDEQKKMGDEELVDVIEMCRKIEAEFEDGPINDAAVALRDLTDEATHYKNEPSESYPGIEDYSHGLTTYLPRTADDFLPKYVGKGAVWRDAAPKWIQLLKQK